MPARRQPYSPEVRAEARRMGNSTMTGQIYEYKLFGADADDIMLGITYVGQNGEPSMAPDDALVDRDKKHTREARSHPNKPFSRYINSYGKAAFGAPRVIAKATGKRLRIMLWLDETEIKAIVARGGTWRDGSYGAAQTLNAKRGGQGDPFRRLCGLAARKLKAGARACEHGRQRSKCKECGGAGICEHGRERSKCKECGGASICEHGRVRSKCKDCGGASRCEHGRERGQCKECGGASICEHGRRRSQCKECGGASICEHGRERSKCKECGGASICEHGRVRSQCKECGGASICEHGRRRSQCKECIGSKGK